MPLKMITFSKLGNYGNNGNQLFQIAATYAHAKKCNTSPLFPLSQKVKWTTQFNVPESFFGNCNVSETYNEPHYHFADIPQKNNVDLIGYFQSEKYFSYCAGEVAHMLTPNEVGDNGEYTAIHVRRTDYLTLHGCYKILDMNYYEKAMSILDAPKYLVFSDDLEWCKKHFIGNQFDFSEERDPIRDFGNMIGCSNFIIGNSTYSWWAAWLNNNPDKTVIAPKTWFGPKLAPTHNAKDLIPLEWAQI